jgi:hypothetical protein
VASALRLVPATKACLVLQRCVIHDAGSTGPCPICLPCSDRSLLRLQEKTGGLVILRTGTLIHLYRGPDYKGPPPRPKVNDITEAIGDQDLFGEDDDLEEGDLMQQFEVEDGICKSAVVTDVDGRDMGVAEDLCLSEIVKWKGGLMQSEMEGGICYFGSHDSLEWCSSPDLCVLVNLSIDSGPLLRSYPCSPDLCVVVSPCIDSGTFSFISK